MVRDTAVRGTRELWQSVRISIIMKPSSLGWMLGSLSVMLVLAVPVHAIEKLEGYWVINAEETDKVRVPFKKDKPNVLSQGRVRGDITIGGVPLPIPGTGRPQPNSTLSAKDPKVLRCSAMQITDNGKKVRIDYDNADKEVLVKGDYRGRDTNWSKAKIEQKYKTPERTVKKSWTLRKDGRLLVSVTLDPRGDRKRVYNRVFDLSEAPASESAEVTESAHAGEPL